MKYLLILSILLLSSCAPRYETTENMRVQRIQFCAEKGLYVFQINDTIFDDTCYTAYDVCIKRLSSTLFKFPNDWGVSSNNQDSISKTIQSEIDRCMKNL